MYLYASLYKEINCNVSGQRWLWIKRDMLTFSFSLSNSLSLSLSLALFLSLSLYIYLQTFYNIV